MRLDVLRYSDNVPGLISGYGDWTVGMVFRRGVLLKRDHEALFIGSLTNSPGPFHMALHENSLRNFLSWAFPGRTFSLNNCAAASDRICLELNGAKDYNCRVTGLDCRADNRTLSVLEEFLESPEMKNGWDVSLCELSENGVGGFRPADFFARTPESIDSFLRYCIGRGKGLTPSGDDFLIGFLSVFTCWEYLYGLVSILLEQHGLTSDVSYYYYMAALNKRFDSNIIGLLHSIHISDLYMQCRYMNLVAEYGHTSGIDTLTGVYFALCCKRVLYGGN